MNDYTNLLKSFLVIVSMALCAAGHAQELCANGIDDDGDGLIDIQDVADCGCSAASTILLQSSFETNSCCPTGRNYSTLIDCLGEGWLTPTGSADYFHTCGFMGDSFSPAVPLPMPSGNGVMGIATFTEFLGSPFPFYESLANCLNSPMTSGETHGISFYLGFGTPAQQLYISTLNTTLALYGKTSCTDLWMGDDDCMTNYGWELITEIPVSAGSEGTWVFVDHTFVPSSDYAAIGIAMTCGDYPVNQYHFIDEVIITGPDQGSGPGDPLALGVSGDCIEGVTIAVLNGDPNADYQWYLDGVAISGATSNPLLVTDAAADGVYQALVTTAGGCQISDLLPVEINENALVVNGLVTDINCSSEEIGSINLSVNSNNLPLTFDWDSGDTSGFIGGLAPGEYHVTVTDANGCLGTNSFSILASPPLEISPSFAEITCSNAATDITIGVLGGSPPFDFLWSNGSTNASLTSVGAGLYEVTVSDANGCSDQTSVEITGVNNPIFIDITAPAMLSCFATSVVLDGSSSTPSDGVTYSWTTPNGMLIGTTDEAIATAGAPGDYTLLVTDLASNCSVMETVTVMANTAPPVAEAGSSIPFGCGDTQLQLNGSGSSVADVAYHWSTTDGTIISGAATLAPIIGTAGTYTLEVTHLGNGCSATDEVIVLEDDVLPIVQVTVNDTLDCATNTMALNASGSSSGAGFTLAWSTNGGHFMDGTDGFFPTVDQPGTYTLDIVNTASGCVNSASVTVLQDTIAPVAVILPPVALNCLVTSQVLDGANSSQGGNIQYQWTTVNGQITSGQNTASAGIDAPGDYQLLVENTGNGCTATTAVTVTENVAIPGFSIPPVGELNCLHESRVITANLDTPIPNPIFQWGTLDGVILGSNTTAQIVASNAGTYTVTVQNPANFCSSTGSVQLTSNSVLPIAEAGMDQVINCMTGTQTLGGDSSAGNTITHHWTSPDAALLVVDSLATLVVNTAGTYILEVQDTSNGCSATDTVQVIEDFQAPTAVIAPPLQLTCTENVVLLDGSASTGTADLSYSWSSTTGSLMGNTAADRANATQAGVYQLVVTNAVNGCSDTTSTVVMQDDNFPSASIAMPLVLTCGRQSVVLSGTASSNSGNTTFTWATMDGNIVQGANTLQPVVDEPGTYTLTVEDLGNNCQTQAVVEVLLDDTPPVAEAGDDFQMDCMEPNHLDGSQSSQGSHITYRWTAQSGAVLLGENTLQPTISAPDTYQLVVTNIHNGCTATDVVVVAQNVPVATLNVIQPPCYGDDGEIAFNSVQGGTPPYTYSINAGAAFQAQPLFGHLAEGVYEVLVEDSNGCTFVETVAIIQPDSLYVFFTEQRVGIDYGDSVQLIARTNLPEASFTQMNWDDAATLSCADCLTPYARPTETTMYHIQVVSENGCEADAWINVLVNRQFPVYFPNAFSPNNDGVNDIFYPIAELGSVTKIHQFHIFDRWGTAVYSGNDFAANDPRHGWDGTKAGEKMNPAVFVYFAEIEFADGRIDIFKGDVMLIR